MGIDGVYSKSTQLLVQYNHYDEYEYEENFGCPNYDVT